MHLLKLKPIGLLVVTVAFAIASMPTFAASPPIFTYQGRVVLPSGLPLEAASVTFTLQLLSPGNECLLYQESHTIDMTGSSGVFSLGLGSGVKAAPFVAVNLEDMLNNDAANIPGLTCTTGTDYDPSPGDSRLLRVSFDDGSGVQTLDADHVIGSVPFAFYADKLDGRDASDFIQGSATIATMQTDLEYLAEERAYLEGLVDGSNTDYARTSDLPVSGGTLDMTGGDVLVNDSPATGGSAVNQNYADGNVGGLILDLDKDSNGIDVDGTQGDNFVISWDQTNQKWIAEPMEDPTKLPLAGGLMAGDITMGGNDIAGAGTIGAITINSTDLTASDATITTLNVTTVNSTDFNVTDIVADTISLSGSNRDILNVDSISATSVTTNILNATGASDIDSDLTVNNLIFDDIGGDTFTWNIEEDGSDNLIFRNNGTTRFTMNSSGNMNFNGNVAAGQFYNRGGPGIDSTNDDAVDFAGKNLVESSADSCDGTNPIEISNMNSGGTYSMILSAGSHSGVCTFTNPGATLTFRYPNGSSNIDLTSVTSDVVVSFMVSGSRVFVAYVTY